MRKIFLFAALLVLLPLSSKAEFVGIDKKTFRDNYYATQQNLNWCWAASASMVMKYQGVPIPQPAIVNYIKNAVVDTGAKTEEISRAVNTVLNSTEGPPSKVVMSGSYILGIPPAHVLYNQLREKKPVIMTYMHAGGGGAGHAVVVTGIDATFVGGNFKVNKVFVFDPFPYIPTPMGLQYNEELVYKTYDLWMEAYGMTLKSPTPSPHEVGLITGMILMNSSIIPNP